MYQTGCFKKLILNDFCVGLLLLFFSKEYICLFGNVRFLLCRWWSFWLGWANLYIWWCNFV